MVQTALLADHRTKLGITFTILVVHIHNLINHINTLGHRIILRIALCKRTLNDLARELRSRYILSITTLYLRHYLTKRRAELLCLRLCLSSPCDLQKEQRDQY